MDTRVQAQPMAPFGSANTQRQIACNSTIPNSLYPLPHLTRFDFLKTLTRSVPTILFFQPHTILVDSLHQYNVLDDFTHCIRNIIEPAYLKPISTTNNPIAATVSSAKKKMGTENEMVAAEVKAMPKFRTARRAAWRCPRGR
jgi:hypothetical protein